MNDGAPAGAEGAGCFNLRQIEAFLSGGPGAERLRGHVDGCATCRAAVEEARANNRLLARLGTRSSSAADATATAVVAGYEILGELGRGGQGMVYRAIQEATKRPVALKVLLAGTLATSRQRRRFEREIELVAGLDHPNIVTIYESGLTEDGRHYFAMQYVDGAPLDAWLADRGPPLPLRARLALLDKILAGVSYAHQRGVIHRDLKPANILVDVEGRAHILDFGLARVVGRDDAPDAARTIAGEFMGTIVYASPEQVRGDTHDVDVRSDVYALGTILFEMLTGRVPHPATDGLAGAVKAITESDPVAPGRCEDVVAGVNHELDTMVLTALARDRERRYQSAAALRADVRHYLAGEPIDAKRDSGWYMLTKTISRYRWRVTAAAVVAVMLLASSVALLVLYQRARTEVRKTTQINLFLEDTLGSVSTSDEGDVTVSELLDEAVEWIDIALSDQPEVAASIRTTVANSYRNLGRFDDARAQAQAALETRHELFGPDHLQAAQSMNVLALIARDRGDLEDAERRLGEVLEVRRRLGGDSYEVSITLANLGLVCRDRGDFDRAETYLDQSLSIRRRLFGDRHSDVAMCHYNLGEVRLAAGDPQGAERHYTDALAVRRVALQRQHPDLARSLEKVGALRLARDPAAAEPLLRERLELRRAAARRDPASIARTALLLASSLEAQDRRDEAVALLEPLHAELTTQLGPEHALTAETAARLSVLRGE